MFKVIADFMTWAPTIRKGRSLVIRELIYINYILRSRTRSKRLNLQDRHDCPAEGEKKGDLKRVVYPGGATL